MNEIQLGEPDLVVADLETTGLDAYEEVPLELALAVIDIDGEVLAEATWLIHDGTSEFKEKVAKAKVHPIVGPMHEKSGLWDMLDNREMYQFGGIWETEQKALRFLDEHNVPRLPLAGNSIGSLDRPFLQAHFPRLNERLHYRNVDFSTLKELCRRHNPRLYENLPEKSEAHRALGDVHESIEEYKFYIDNFLYVSR